MIKKIVSATAAVIMFVTSAVTAFAKTEYQTTEVPVPTNVLVLGDSIATGYGLKDYSSSDYSKCGSYANILSGKFKAELPEDCRYTFTNLAKDGRTSEDLLDQLVSGECDEYLAKADCVLVSIGGNDLLHAIWDTLEEVGLKDFENISGTDLLKLPSAYSKLKDKADENLTLFDKNLPSIAKYIKSRTKGEVIFQTLYDPFEGFTKIPKIADMAAERIARLNEITKSHAGDPSAQYTVCDLAPAFKGRPVELTNINDMDIHPNAEGHKLIAEKLEPVIRQGKYSYEKAVEVPDAETADTKTTDSSSDKDDSSLTTIIICCSSGAVVLLCAVIVVIKKKKA